MRAKNRKPQFNYGLDEEDLEVPKKNPARGSVGCPGGI